MINASALRPRLEHAQIMTKEDMARLGRLGGALIDERLECAH